MSDPSDKTLEKLVADVFSQLASLRGLVLDSREAITALAALLTNHTAALRGHQAAIETMATQLGLSFTPDEPAAPEQPPN